jgi:hypothetical protein
MEALHMLFAIFGETGHVKSPLVDGSINPEDSLRFSTGQLQGKGGILYKKKY